MTSARNIIDKLWDAHVVHRNENHPAIFAIDLMLLHEVTSAQAFDTLRSKGLPVFDTKRCVATVDHSIPTRKNRHVFLDQIAENQVDTLRRNCEEYGIALFDYDSGRQGIVHVIGPELGLTQPGMTIVCGDSHTSTHGAFGVLAFGIGTSEVGHVLATGCLLQEKPLTMKVEFKGQFQRGVFAKDAILKLIAEIGIGGANGHFIEYCGEAVRSMSMEERMTICNMSIECGARGGIISPDNTTFEYLRGKAYSPTDVAFDDAVENWSQFASDRDCPYDQEVTIEVSNLAPMVTWGTNPEQAVEVHETVPQLKKVAADKRDSAAQAMDYVQLEQGTPLTGVPVDWAFIGSCTNGRIEDLRIAAEVLRGNKIHQDVTFYVVPGSEAVSKQAEEEGLRTIIEDAGAEFRMPGCSMCLAMNDDKVPAGSRCISSTNRNFVGRQGSGSFTHLASPATVAASAIAGKIASSAHYFE